jgi:RHS repeat-associated protein
MSTEAHPVPCPGSRRLVGDPVDVVTGANTDVAVDFRLHGPLPLLWRRYYNSARNKVSCPLGWGQTHDFDRTLTNDLEGLRYTDPLGGVIAFPPLGIEESAANSGLVLRRLSANTYELVQAGQPVEDFEFGLASDTARLGRLRQEDAQINFRYGADGRLCEIMDSLGRPITVESDRNGRILGLFLADASAPGKRRALLVYEYDAAGNPVTAQDMYNATLGFGWDQHNRLTCRTDRRGYSFHFDYDEQGRCVHSRGDDGLLEVFLDYQPELKTTFVRRGDGGQWTYFYNAAGTVTQITDPYGGTTSFTVDDEGHVTEETDPKGNVTRLIYDGAGRHYARLDPLGHMLPTSDENPNPPDPLAYQLPDTPLEWEHGRLFAGRKILWPTLGDPAFEEFPWAVTSAFLESEARQAPGEKEQGLNPVAHEAPAAKDEQGRSVEQGPPGQIERGKYDPNGNLAEYHDRDGAVYRYAYRSWNALHQETDPLGHTTVFNHSTQGLVNRVEDPGGTVTEYGYDLKDRLVEVRCHGRVLERYGYDACANIIEKTDGQGRTLVAWKVGPATLDVLRRLGSGETHSFEYDERGRIIAATTPDGSATFEFTEDGERVADKRDGLGVTHEFELDRLVATAYLDKFRVSYKAEANGDLVITDPTGARHRVRVSDGGLVARHLASGTRELCLYDTTGRCRRKALARDGQYGTPWIRTYSYSPAGDLLGVTDLLHGSTHYRYDKAHRIAEETLPDGARRAFSYDSAGNLRLQPGLTGVEMAPGNRLRAANGDLFTYNDRDHLSARQGRSGTTHYEFNALDMLVRCEINGESWTASYDALCRRIRKSWRGLTTTYYWDDFRLAVEVRHNGSIRLYVYEDQVALVPFMFVEYPGLASPPASGKRYYIVTNQIGVPIRVEDDEGRSCWSARIDPYGLVQVARESTLEMPLRFPGHYHDPETGLHYNRFRDFSPELGRYLQSDPAGQEGGINLYAYPAYPLTGADIDGLGAKNRPSGRKSKGAPTGKGAGCPILKAKLREIDKEYRELIKKPPKGKTPDDMRYARHKARSKAAGVEPLPRSKWDKAKEQADKNRRRGSVKEDNARKGLEQHIGGKLDNNNTDAPVTHTHDGKTTRPDSVGTDKDGNKVVHDHKDKTGKDKVIYDDDQMKAQRDMAGEDGRHIVTTSSDKPKLTADPPEPRPSKPLAEKSEVHYTNKDGKVTHTWDKDAKDGDGAWVPVEE